jgi:RNA polymerase sigma-70 factor, ECF subfamily
LSTNLPDISGLVTTESAITDSRDSWSTSEGVHRDRVSFGYTRDGVRNNCERSIQATELLEAALGGDRGAYNSLLELLRRRLGVFFAHKLGGTPFEVEDLVQESLLAIHNRRETFDCAQRFMPWAYAIARHKMVDHFRRTLRGTSVPLHSAGALFVDDESAAVEARLDIEKALALLPKRSRALLRSVKLDGLSIAEAAELHGLSESAVKVGVHRSMWRLIAQLRRSGPAYEG